MGLLDNISGAMSDQRNRQIFGAGLLDMTAGFSGKQQNHVANAMRQLSLDDEAKRRNKYQDFQMSQAEAKAAAAAEQKLMQDAYLEQLGIENPDLAAAASAGMMDLYKYQNPAQKMTDDISEYEYARSQGNPGDFNDWMQSQEVLSQKALQQQLQIAGAEANITAQAGRDSRALERSQKAAEITAATQTQRAQEVGSAEIKRDMLTDNIDLAKDQAGVMTTGFIGQQTQDIGGTPAHNLQQTLNTIKANSGFDRLQEMRNQSKTGGALGQVSERELSLLIAAQGALEQSQTEPQLKRNLTIYQEKVKNSWNNVYDAYKKDYGVKHPEDLRGIPGTSSTVTPLPGGWTVRKK